MICNKCGSEIPEGARFCPYCCAPVTNSIEFGQAKPYNADDVEKIEVENVKEPEFTPLNPEDFNKVTMQSMGQDGTKLNNYKPKMKVYDTKAPLYKKWWFWGLIIVGLFVLVFSVGNAIGGLLSDGLKMLITHEVSV